MIAKGIIAAATELNLKIPLVVRLQGILYYTVLLTVQVLFIAIGNNQNKAKALIDVSNLRMLAVEDFDVATKTVCV